MKTRKTVRRAVDARHGARPHRTYTVQYRPVPYALHVWTFSLSSQTTPFMTCLLRSS